MTNKINPLAIFCSILAANFSLADQNITEIVVEAEYLANNVANSIKSPTPVINVPQSVSIISSERINEQGFSSIEDIISYVPGVTMSQGEGHRDAVVFRGVRSTADFFIDGARDDVQYYRPLYNLEQVEILRGPNALLFGRGGTGGVLNRVTKKAELGSNFTTYKAGADKFGGYSLQVDNNTSLSTNSAVRLNAYYEELDGARDFAGGERTGFNPTLRYSPSDDTILDLSYEYIDHQRFIDRGIPTGADGRPVENLAEAVFGDPELNTTELEAHIVRMALEQNLTDNLKLNLSMHYGNYDKMYQNFYVSDYDPDRVADTLAGERDGIYLLDGYRDSTQRENLVTSGNLIGEFDNHTFILGAEFINTSSDQNRYNSNWTPNANGKDDTAWFDLPLGLINGSAQGVTNDFTLSVADNSEVNIKVHSVYIQDEITLNDNLNVILGARYDSFETDIADIKNTAFTSFKDEQLSPRAGLIYKPQNNVSVYVSYSESFLPATGEQLVYKKGIGDLGETVNGVFYHDEPETFENQEVGVKLDLSNGISVTAAYFESDQVIADVDSNNGEILEVRGFETEGIEIQAQGRLTDSISFNASMTNQDGLTKDGKTPKELPENTASIWVNSQVSDTFGFGFGMVYQDESLIKDGKDLTLPSYTRFDASANYVLSDDMSLGIHLENLTDEVYFPHAHSDHQASVGSPFSARITLSGQL